MARDTGGTDVDAIDTPAQVGNRARNMLRDFPVFFEETHSPLTSPTIRLSHPLVTDIVLRSIEDGGVDNNFRLDRRNGVIQLHDPESLTPGIQIAGYHYEYFLEEDLEFFSEMIMAEFLHGRTDIDNWSQFMYEEKNVGAMGTVSLALFSLMTELSTQIDVSTPEGMMIPAHMRFQQVQQMYQFWHQKFQEKASLLNIGLERIEVGVLRRVSRTTNRLVPVFRDREVDDPRPPIRVFPAIPPVVPAVEEGGSEGAGGLNPEYGISGGGWESIGRSGA